MDTKHVDGAGEKSRAESMEIAEAAREATRTLPSLGAEVFLGRFEPSLVFPFPAQPDDDRRSCDELAAQVEAFLKTDVDADAIDRTGEMPREVLAGLARLGLFGMKIPKEYGGLGLSQTNYNRIVSLVASHCGSTAVWLSAHQSIGVPQPLKMFGTDAQKKRYLPRLAKGEISAFALTEPGVGSDPARMMTTATPTPDGQHWILNGEKLWCTNGPDADILIVMARTPSITVNGKERKQVTAFIVETKSPGFSVAHRCRFMGLRGISNGLLKFENVKVPAENVLWGTGQGLKLALITLNTGRLTLPAACAGIAKQCVSMVRRWAVERVQWGAPIGHHDAVAQKIAWMASHAFAMEAVSLYASGLADRGGADIRMEAAIAKLFCSEVGGQISREAFQVRGGRGFENAESLAARGEAPFPVERIVRDGFINTIIEGTTQVMHLFLAREALDPHLRRAGAMFDPKTGILAKAAIAAKAVAHYVPWYAKQWLPIPVAIAPGTPPPLAPHVKFIGRASRKLARTIFHAMALNGPKLERKQALLGRIVDVGTDLVAMAATCGLAADRATRGAASASGSPVDLADHFCRTARRRIGASFRAIGRNDDAAGYRVARSVLGGDVLWLEDGILAAPDAASGAGGDFFPLEPTEERRTPVH